MTPEAATKTLKKGTRIQCFGKYATVTANYSRKYPKVVSVQWVEGAQRTSLQISEVTLAA